MAQKFIIYRKVGSWETGIRFGNVRLHRDLLNENEACMGGGAYIRDDGKKMMVCYDESFDFGQPRFEDLKYVPDWLKGWKLVYSFHLQDKVKDDILKRTNEEIEYIKDGDN